MKNLPFKEKITALQNQLSEATRDRDEAERLLKISNYRNVRKNSLIDMWAFGAKFFFATTAILSLYLILS